MNNLFNLNYSVETITPDLAARYLLNRGKNRPIHKKYVDLYANSMKRGIWRVNSANPITFADDGTLLDGQHRLNAVIKANLPITMTILRGADKEDFAVMDTGVKRSGSDVLALKGYPNSVGISSIINYYLSLKKGQATTEDGAARGQVSTFITNTDILNEYETDMDFYQTLHKISVEIYSKYRFFTVSQVGGVITLLVKEKHYDLEKAVEFFKLINNSEDGKYPYIEYLRSKMMASMRRQSDKDKLTGQVKMVMLSKAWNYFVSGENRKIIIYRVGDKMVFD